MYIRNSNHTFISIFITDIELYFSWCETFRARISKRVVERHKTNDCGKNLAVYRALKRDCKNNSHQTYSYLRNCRASASWGSPWNPSDHHNTIVLRGLREGIGLNGLTLCREASISPIGDEIFPASTFAVRETASLGIMAAPRVPPLNPSESIVLSKHYRLWGV